MPRDLFGIQAFGDHPHRIQFDVDGIAGYDHTVPQLDHARQLFKASGDLRRIAAQLWQIGTEQFDFDRLRHCRQITDEVFHQL